MGNKIYVGGLPFAVTGDRLQAVSYTHLTLPTKA